MLLTFFNNIGRFFKITNYYLQLFELLFGIRLLELFGGLCALMVSRMKLCIFTDHIVNQTVLCEVRNRTFSYKSDKDTNVWMKGENQLVSKKEQCSVPDVLNGLRAREEGPSIYVPEN